MSEGKRKGGSARAALGRSGRGENIRRSLGRGGVSPLEDDESPESPESQETGHSKNSERVGEGHGKEKPRTKRITVDLPISEHRFLRDYAYDHDADGMKVVRALLAELADNPELDDHVRERLASQ